MMTILLVYICLITQRCTLFKRRVYSNTVNIMLFFSDIKQYIPVKLCKSAGSIHLIQIYGQLNSDQIVLEKNCLWDLPVDFGATVWVYDTEVTHSLAMGQYQAMAELPLEHVMLLVEWAPV